MKQKCQQNDKKTERMKKSMDPGVSSRSCDDNNNNYNNISTTVVQFDSENFNTIDVKILLQAILVSLVTVTCVFIFHCVAR